MGADSFLRSHRRLDLLIGVGIALALLSTLFGISPAQAGSISAAELLNPDGTLNLTTGKEGMVDMSGWRVRLDPQRGPVFAPDAPAANSWSALGKGLDGEATSIVLSGSNLYVGGTFTQVCSNEACDSFVKTVNHIAKWNGSAWSALGNGVSGKVTTVAVQNSSVYVGGLFDEVCGNVTCDSGNVTANNVAKWNGSSWSALGNGVNDWVYVLTVNGSDVYAGGFFTEVCGNEACDSGNVTVNQVAKWNGGSWSPLGNGLRKTGSSTHVHAFLQKGSDLYVGGSFSEVCGNAACNSGNLTVNRIARWDGIHWSALGDGVSNTVNALTTNGSDVYLGGWFNDLCGNADCNSGNVLVNSVAKWNGSSLSGFTKGVDGGVFSLALNGNDVYVGGLFDNACANTACDAKVLVNGVAKWNGTSWSPLGNGVLFGLVTALVPNGQDMYVGGTFTEVCGNAACDNGNKTVNHIARYGESGGCSAKPAKPTLTSPSDGVTLPKTQVTLKWQNVACETKYKVQVRNEGTNEVEFSANPGADVVKVKTTALTKGATFKWFVKACNSFGCTKSVAREFSIAP